MNILKISISDISSISELQDSVPRKTTGMRARLVEATERDDRSRWGAFSAARACGDTIRTYCGSSVKFYFLMIFDFFELGFFGGSGRRSQPPSRSRKIFSSKHDRHRGVRLEA